MPKSTASTTWTMVRVSGEPSFLRTIQVALQTLHLHSRHIVQHHLVRSSQHSSDNLHAPLIQHPHRQYTRRRKDRKITSRTHALRTRTVTESKQAQRRLRPKATWLPESHIPAPVVAESTVTLLQATITTIIVSRVRQTIHAQQLRRALPTSLTTQCHLIELNHRAVLMAKLTFRQTGLLAAGDHLQITTTSPLDPLVAPAVGNRQLNQHLISWILLNGSRLRTQRFDRSK